MLQHQLRSHHVQQSHDRRRGLNIRVLSYSAKAVCDMGFDPIAVYVRDDQGTSLKQCTKTLAAKQVKGLILVRHVSLGSAFHLLHLLGEGLAVSGSAGQVLS